MKNDLAAVADHAFIVSALPAIEADVAKQLQALVNKTIMALEQQKLTPDLAMYAWMEYRAISMVAKKFATRVRVGTSAGETLASLLDKAGNNS